MFNVLDVKIEYVYNTNTGIFLKANYLNNRIGLIDSTIISNLDLGFNDLTKYTWIICNLYVNPEFRRKGIFKLLINKAQNIMKEKGADTIILNPDPYSEIGQQTLIDIYVKEGYEHYWEGINYMYKFI